MRLKKMMAAALAATMLTALAGCGGTSGSNGEAATDKEDTGKADTEKAESGEKQQVQLWHYFSASNQEVLEKMIKEYNGSQEEVEVIPTYIARADLMKQYTMGAISGELPDIGMVDSPDMASFIEMGVFDDITDMVDDWGQLDQFYEGPLSSCKQEDKIYGLPQNTNCLALYYNIDLLEQAGFTEADIPTTWPEFREFAKKCTTDQHYGYAMSAKGTEEGTFSYIPYLYSSGASVETMDSPEAVKSMEFISGMAKDGSMSPEAVNWTQTDVRDAFTAGKAVMMENGSWQIATLDELSKETGMRYGVTYLPADQKKSTVLGGENFGICTGANKEASFQFFEFMMGKEGNAQFNLEAGKFPIREDSMQSEDIWTTNEKYKIFADSMDFAVARGPHAQWPTISEGIYGALQAAILGEKTPEAAMTDAAAVAAGVYGK